MSDPDLIEDDRPHTAGFVRDVVRTWLPAILAVLAIRTFVFEPFRIPSGSMVPTLQIGDHVVVSKAQYGLWVPQTLIEIPFMDTFWVVPRIEVFDWGDPQRGDIIVFRFPEQESVNYIKRVVAIPGDTIKVIDNQVVLDGEPQEREYQKRYTFVNDKCTPADTKLWVEHLADVDHEMLTRVGLPGHLADYPPPGAEPGGQVTVPPGHVFVMGDNRDNSEDSRAWKFVRYDQIKGKAHFVWFSWDSCEGGTRSSRFFRSLYE
ncbi:MAG: signal peptidase I [Myxococcota bacterium]